MQAPHSNGPTIPPERSAEFGAARVLVIEAALAGLSAPVAGPGSGELLDWSRDIAARAYGVRRGLVMPEGLSAWRRTLAGIGVPLGLSQDLMWGRDVVEHATLQLPSLRDGIMQLPVLQILESLTSLQLKPLRMFVAHKLGCRLQIATKVHFYLWANQSLLISCAGVPVGGFLYGPEPGQRHSLSIPIGGYQLLTW